MHPFEGVFPAITTQLHEDQSLDLVGTGDHLEALIASGIQGVVVCGSLGENQTLAPDEKIAVVRTAVEVAAGRIPVLTGVAETSTAAAVNYIEQAESLGVSGFMIMPPMVYRPDETETLQFFRRCSAATSRPWMLYNNPVGYATDVTPDRLQQLTDLDNLVAVKESSANPRRITEIRNQLGDRFALFTGVDDLMLESAILGIDGWVAGSGIGFPEHNQRLWELTRRGQWDEARRLYRWSQPLMKLDTHLHFVQYIKLLVQEAGLGREWVREPRLPLRGAERDQVLSIIHTGLAHRPALEDFPLPPA